MHAAESLHGTSCLLVGCSPLGGAVESSPPCVPSQVPRCVSVCGTCTETRKDPAQEEKPGRAPTLPAADHSQALDRNNRKHALKGSALPLWETEHSGCWSPVSTVWNLECLGWA